MQKNSLLLLVLIGLFLNIVHAQQTKDPVNYASKNWQKTTDENIVYYHTKSVGRPGKKTDSVSLKVLGSLDSNQHLIASPFDALVFESFYGVEQKKYAKEDFLKLSLGETIKDMPDGGIVYVRCKKDLQFFERATFSLRIYFNEPEDTISQRKFVNEILPKGFADSIKYYTKEEGGALYLSEAEAESWKNVLDMSPFPAFAIVYINKEFVNEKYISEIAKEIKESKLVSSVEYPNLKTFTGIDEFERLYKIPFILRAEVD